MAFRQLVSRIQTGGPQLRPVLSVIQTTSCAPAISHTRHIHNPHKYKDDEDNVFNEYSFVERARPVMKEELSKMKSREVSPNKSIGVGIVICMALYMFYNANNIELQTPRPELSSPSKKD